MINDINSERQLANLIRELGVFELRALARQLGVSSPTTKKREELISLIIEARKDGKLIDDSFPKRGRPFKRLNVLDHIANKITPEVSNEKLDFVSVVKFAQEDMPILDDLIDNEIFIFEGIVRKFDDKAMFFDMQTNKSVHISKEFELFNILDSGDRIKVKAKALVGQNQYIVVDILEINKNSPENYIPQYAQLGEEIIDNRELPYSQGKVIYGRRNACLVKQDIFENSDFVKFYKECKNKNYHLILMGTNVSYENQIFFKNMNLTENFTTVYGTNVDESFNKIIDAIFYAYNLVSKGQQVVIYVTDLMEIVKCIDKNLKKEPNEDYSSKAKVVIQKLLAFARSYESGISGTLLMCYRECDIPDKYLTNDILKICHNVCI